MVTYLDPSRVKDERITTPPRNRSRSGYGSKIGTAHELLLDDGRWRRVYVVCWSNAGSAYVLEKGRLLFLGAYTFVK